MVKISSLARLQRNPQNLHLISRIRYCTYENIYDNIMMKCNCVNVHNTTVYTRSNFKFLNYKFSIHKTQSLNYSYIGKPTVFYVWHKNFDKEIYHTVGLSVIFVKFARRHKLRNG